MDVLLGLKVEGGPREEARWSESRCGQPVSTESNGSPSPIPVDSVAAVTEQAQPSRSRPLRAAVPSSVSEETHLSALETDESTLLSMYPTPWKSVRHHI